MLGAPGRAWRGRRPREADRRAGMVASAPTCAAGNAEIAPRRPSGSYRSRPCRRDHRAPSVDDRGAEPLRVGGFDRRAAASRQSIEQVAVARRSDQSTSTGRCRQAAVFGRIGDQFVEHQRQRRIGLRVEQRRRRPSTTIRSACSARKAAASASISGLSGAGPQWSSVIWLWARASAWMRPSISCDEILDLRAGLGLRLADQAADQRRGCCGRGG